MEIQISSLVCVRCGQVSLTENTLQWLEDLMDKSHPPGAPGQLLRNHDSYLRDQAAKIERLRKTFKGISKEELRNSARESALEEFAEDRRAAG